MASSALLRVAFAASCVLASLSSVAAWAAPSFTAGGDGAFRNITATGGALPGVDVSGALVTSGGSRTTLSTVAAQAGNAVPLSMSGQPNGWLQLDGNGLVPTASLPVSVLNPVDATARAAAAQAAATATRAANAASVAQTAAGAAMPASAIGQVGGVAPLDGNGFVPLANLPASVTSPVDQTARNAAATANSAANAALTMASAAEPTSQAGKAGGFAVLDGNALVPTANLPAAYTASTAIAASTLGQPKGPAQLDNGGTLSGNLVVASWSAAIGRTLGARATDRLNVKDFGAVGDGVHDDTASIQAAINIAVTANLGYEVDIPSGHYLLTSTLTASITGNAGLHLHGAGSGETMLEWEIPAAAKSQDGLDVRAGGISVNTPWGQQPFVAKQFVRVEGIAFVANGYASHPAGNGLSLTASYNSATPSTLSFGTVLDVAFVGGGHSQPTNTGPNSGSDGWLNAVYLKGVQNVTLSNVSVYPPQGQSCSSTASEPGYTSDCKYVAGAGVLLDADPSNYGNQTQGVSVSGLDVKGYQAAFAEGGITQGNGLTGGNFFGDRYGAVLGGGVIFDQLAGPPVATTAFGYGGDFGFDVPTTNGLSVGMKVVLSGAAGAIPELATIASIASSADANGQYRVTWAAPNDQNTVTFSGDTCSFANGSVTATASCSGTSGAHSLTVTNASGMITSGMSISDKTTPSNVPTGESVSSVSGTTISYAKTGGQNNYSFGTASSGVAVNFTNGFVLTTPYGSGGFFWSGGACDVYLSCLYAPTDPESAYGYGGISMHDVGIIANDASPNDIIIDLGSTGGNDFYDINATSGGGGVQQFLVQSGEPVGSAQGTYVYNNQISTQGSTSPQIVLANVPNSAVYDNSVSGMTPLGTDNIAANFWGLNYSGGQVRLGIAGGGAAAAATPFGLAVSTVASLPSTCFAGQMAYAIDGRKPGEAPGAGSGTPVVCTQATPSGSLQWWALFGNTQVLH